MLSVAPQGIKKAKIIKSRKNLNNYYTIIY